MPYDDAATAKLGPGWHIPTKKEFEELITNCTIQEVTMDGAEGYAMVSKINNNYIFMRSSGYTADNKRYSKNDAIFWTAELDGFVFRARGLRVCKDGTTISASTIWAYERYYGLNIRPIYY